jgi:hypothetical protein
MSIFVRSGTAWAVTHVVNNSNGKTQATTLRVTCAELNCMVTWLAFFCLLMAIASPLQQSPFHFCALNGILIVQLKFKWPDTPLVTHSQYQRRPPALITHSPSN